MSQKYVILVTGAATGIGQLSAHSLAEAGHTVYASMRDIRGRNAVRAQKEYDYAAAHGVDLRIVELDVTSQESANQAVQTILTEQDHIDVVMHNAGHLVVGYAEAFTAEEIEHLFSTNALGVVRVNRAVLPHLRKRGEGLLLYTGSTTTVVVPPFLGPYVASKMAMDGLAQTTAYEVSQFGIETCIVMPGAFTQGTEHFPDATRPADATTTASYERLDAMVARYEEATNGLFTPGVDAHPQAVADEVVRIVGLPAGTRPFRSVIDFTEGRVEEANALLWELQKDFLTRMGYGMLLSTDALGPEVHIETGIVRGVPRDEHGVLAFKGIPYAAPPVDDLRWRAPQPPRTWTGVRDATQFGPRCWSAWGDDPTPWPAQSEDCLSLNIWTAAHRAEEKRPVMVWIHGGGFQFGASADPSTDGSRLAEKGVVVVSFNYRVGVFGFMAHPELDQEGPSGNYGLQDQLAALRWVQSNIARFGGDPDNVTVFGESAGAHAVGILLASPLAKGLIHKAIGESGAFWDSDHGSLSTFDEAHARGEAFVKRMGASSIEALRTMPAEQVNAAALWNFTEDPVLAAFSPNIDRYVVPEVPATRYLHAEQLAIPLLAGWNDVEHWPFRARALPHQTVQDFRQAAEHMFGKHRLAEFLSLYPAESDAQAAESAEALTGDLIISEQTWLWLELQRRTGRAPVYGYTFTYTSPYVPIASHLVEVSFVFGTLTPQFLVGGVAPPADADRALSDTIMSYWVNFATRGNPNGPGLPHWPAYDEKGTIQNLDQTVGPQSNVREARFRFLASYRTEGVLPADWRSEAVQDIKM